MKKKIFLAGSTLFFLLYPFQMAGAEPARRKVLELVAVTSLTLLVALAFFILAGALLAIQSLILLTFPDLVERSRQLQKKKRARLAFLGLINTVGMLFICAVLLGLKHPLPGLIALAIFVTFLAILLLSLSAASTRLGKALLSDSNGASHSYLCLLAGWFTLAFCLFIPILGWLVILYQAFAGLGSTMLALFQEKEKGETPLLESGKREKEGRGEKDLERDNFPEI